MARTVYALSGQGRGHSWRGMGLAVGPIERTHCARFRGCDAAEGRAAIFGRLLRQVSHGDTVLGIGKLIANRTSIRDLSQLATRLSDSLEGFRYGLSTSGFETFLWRDAVPPGDPEGSLDHQRIAAEAPCIIGSPTAAVAVAQRPACYRRAMQSGPAGAAFVFLPARKACLRCRTVASCRAVLGPGVHPARRRMHALASQQGGRQRRASGRASESTVSSSDVGIFAPARPTGLSRDACRIHRGISRPSGRLRRPWLPVPVHADEQRIKTARAAAAGTGQECFRISAGNGSPGPAVPSAGQAAAALVHPKTGPAFRPRAEPKILREQRGAVKYRRIDNARWANGSWQTCFAYGTVADSCDGLS